MPRRIHTRLSYPTSFMNSRIMWVETNHLPHLISMIVSDEFFQDLPEDKQAILVEAAEIAKEEARQASDDRIADKIKVIEDSGTQIVTLSDELRAEIREAVQPVYDEIEKNVDKKVFYNYLKRQCDNYALDFEDLINFHFIYFKQE